MDRRFAVPGRGDRTVKGRVLVIDDEPEVRRSLTAGLVPEGCCVAACADGLAAIQEWDRARAKGEGFDFLITAIFLPDIDGLKLMKVMRRQAPDLCALVLTAFGDEALRRAALSQPNTAYLEKPFAITDALAALERLAAARAHQGADAHATSGNDTAGALSGNHAARAYLTLRVTDWARSLEIYEELAELEGVKACDAVRGDADIILHVNAPTRERIAILLEKVKSVSGVQVIFFDVVETPPIDPGVLRFIETYREVIQGEEPSTAHPPVASYVIVDIDRQALQPVFATMCFLDEIASCDAIEGGARLVGTIRASEAVGRTPHLVEKMNQVEGVLRVREAKVFAIGEGQ